MIKRIVFLNIFRGNLYDTDYQTVVDAAKGPDTEVDVWSFPRSEDGSEGDVFHQLKLHRYESLTLSATLGRVQEAEAKGYDGFVIGCFNDPGLAEAREVAQGIVVAAPCEASLHVAAALGRRFSVLTVRQGHVPQVEENIRHYGFESQLASVRTIGVPTAELQDDLKKTTERLVAVGTRAVREDGADVLLLGCTNYFGLYEKVQQEVGVPVIDPIVSSLKFAEFLIDLRRRFGWRYRRVAELAD